MDEFLLRLLKEGCSPRELFLGRSVSEASVIPRAEIDLFVSQNVGDGNAIILSKWAKEYEELVKEKTRKLKDNEWFDLSFGPDKLDYIVIVKAGGRLFAAEGVEKEFDLYTFEQVGLLAYKQFIYRNIGEFSNLVKKQGIKKLNSSFYKFISSAGKVGNWSKDGLQGGWDKFVVAARKYETYFDMQKLRLLSYIRP